MKQLALALAAKLTDPGQALNCLREYLQVFVLGTLHDCEAFRSLAFVGETALRFLHNIPRFSEDLDFSLTNADNFTGEKWMNKLKAELSLSGFEPEATWNDRKSVHIGWVRLSSVLHEAGLSAFPSQKLAIKLEIDTNPPAGAHCERHVITRFRTFAIQHYDLSSLLAGKIHAAITRKYIKGRDWYDLLWYRSQRPPVDPNLALLQNAFDQTQGAGSLIARNWVEYVRFRLDSVDFDVIAADVLPFLDSASPLGRCNGY